jgi:hypothetical protein
VPHAIAAASGAARDGCISRRCSEPSWRVSLLSFECRRGAGSATDGLTLRCGKKMGLDLTYKAGDQHFRIRFSMADWQTIEQLEQHLPAAVSACFNVQQFGEPVLVPLVTLRESLAQIDSFLAEHPELLPYTYQFKSEYMQMGDKRIVVFDRFDTGGQSGFQLPGDADHWYAIWAGLNELRLEKMAVMPDGTGKVVEQRDLRGEKELMTSNSGRVQFRKRRAKTSLRRGLRDIREFLAGVNEPEITKILG